MKSTAAGLVRALLCALLCLPAAAAFAVPDDLPPVPAAGKRLTDLTHSINPAEQAQVIGKLKEIEEKTGAQVAVLVVAGTAPLSMEEYAIRVFDAWKLGQARVDNGLIVLIATADKKVRIEVGRGLEGAIPDAVAKRLIDGLMLPPFSQGKWAAGILAGLDGILARLRLETPVAPVAKPAAAPQKSESPGFLVQLAIMIGVMGLFGFLNSKFGRKQAVAPLISTDSDTFRSYSGSGSGSGSSADANAMSGGGGESAGGGATSSFGDSSSGSDSGSSSSDSGGSSDSGSSSDNN